MAGRHVVAAPIRVHGTSGEPRIRVGPPHRRQPLTGAVGRDDLVDSAHVNLLRQTFLRRIDLEYTFRVFEQTGVAGSVAGSTRSPAAEFCIGHGSFMGLPPQGR
jgi:hypothetical protein